MTINQKLGDRLPSYRRPPVVEVTCGIRFQPFPNFTVPYFGLLWNKFRNNYPRVQHAPPLAVGGDQILIDMATGVPLPRVWFINEEDNQLIQFQPDRIYYNWRQRNDIYPRYEKVIERFEEVLDIFEGVLKESEFGDLVPIECELTYVNHIVKNPSKGTIEELQRVFRDFSWNYSTRFLPTPNNISWVMKFALPDRKGQLTASLKEGTLKEGNISLFILNLTAKGIGQDADRNGLREWFDTAHTWIVRGFTDLTSNVVQEEVWEREDA